MKFKEHYDGDENIIRYNIVLVCWLKYMLSYYYYFLNIVTIHRHFPLLCIFFRRTPVSIGATSCFTCYSTRWTSHVTCQSNARNSGLFQSSMYMCLNCCVENSVYLCCTLLLEGGSNVLSMRTTYTLICITYVILGVRFYVYIFSWIASHICLCEQRMVWYVHV